MCSMLYCADEAIEHAVDCALVVPHVALSKHTEGEGGQTDGGTWHSSGKLAKLRCEADELDVCLGCYVTPSAPTSVGACASQSRYTLSSTLFPVSVRSRRLAGSLHRSRSDPTQLRR